MNSSDFGTLGAYFELEATTNRIKELEIQLAEKDKEIEKLKSALEYNENNIPNQRKAIRHQVINEIREEIVYYTISRLANDGSVLENCWGIKMKDLNKLLDQIEQGDK